MSNIELFCVLPLQLKVVFGVGGVAPLLYTEAYLFKGFLENTYPFSDKTPHYVTEKEEQNKGTECSQRGASLLISYSFRFGLNLLKLLLRYSLFQDL